MSDHGKHGKHEDDKSLTKACTRGAFLALVRMSNRNSGETPLLNRLVLLAADIDAGIFRQYLDVIRPLVCNITIYVSDNDSALALSQEVHGYPRLGISGPHLQDLDGIEVIDVSATGRRRASGHLYHLYNNIVINDLDQLLNEGKPASDRSGLQQDLQIGRNYWKLFPPDVNWWLIKKSPLALLSIVIIAGKSHRLDKPCE